MWTLLPVASFLSIVATIVFILFIISALLLMVVVLLQEGKGGGLAGAFGGAGADTFGVKAGTVNKFTSYVGAAFLGLALLHAGLSARIQDEDLSADTGGSTLEGTGFEGEKDDAPGAIDPGSAEKPGDAENAGGGD